MVGDGKLKEGASRRRSLCLREHASLTARRMDVGGWDASPVPATLGGVAGEGVRQRQE